MNEQASTLVECLREAVEQYGGRQFDVTSYIHMETLDVIMETAMGKCLQMQTTTNGWTYAQALKDFSHATMCRIAQPWLWPQFLFNLTTSGRSYWKSLTIMKDFSKQARAFTF